MITNILTNITITAYCACKLCCGPQAKGICANGKAPQAGQTIAGSRGLPFNTRVIIKGYRYTGQAGRGDTVFLVQDRLAKRYDSRFDIYFREHKSAKAFGIKTNQTVTIITTK